MRYNILYQIALSQQRFYLDRIRILENILEHTQRNDEYTEKLNAEYKFFIDKLDDLRRQNFDERKV
jgi:hypothetical protein